MLIERVKIENYRSIRYAELQLENLTAFIGSNGAGKSTVLKAINAFFDTPQSLAIDDFHERESSSPISIQLTFRDFSKTEKQRFKSYIFDNQLTITRRFIHGGDKDSGKYFGTTLRNAEFNEYRMADSVTVRRSAYKALREIKKYSTLPSETGKDAMDLALEVWEQENPSECRPEISEVQFLGYTGVAKGTIAKATKFVLVPAVRDASAEAQDSKSPIQKLLEVIVTEALEANSALKALRNETDEKFKKIMGGNAVPELEGLSDVLTTTMSSYYPNSGVKLTWQQPDEMELPNLRPDVLLQDEHFVAHASSMGHGLQRAFIMTLLQHLAIGLPRANATTEENSMITDDADEQTSLIVAIEEPELYQHPTRQKHFSSLLRRLTTHGLNEGRVKVQIIHATHSPTFVDIHHANQIHLTRKEVITGSIHRVSTFFHVTNEALNDRLRRAEDAIGTVPDAPPALAVIPRGHTLNPELNEGFFAKGVVLCEGISDVAAVLGQAKIMGIDFIANDIAVLPCNGKANIDRPREIFGLMGIPVYCIWDSDISALHKFTQEPQSEKRKQAKATAIKLNRLLLASLGESVTDWPSGIYRTGAAFEDDLEATLKSELGTEFYDGWYGTHSIKYGYASVKDAKKNPYILEVLLTDANENGKSSPTLIRIVTAIRDLLLN